MQHGGAAPTRERRQPAPSRRSGSTRDAGSRSSGLTPRQRMSILRLARKVWLRKLCAVARLAPALAAWVRRVRGLGSGIVGLPPPEQLWMGLLISRGRRQRGAVAPLSCGPLALAAPAAAVEGGPLVAAAGGTAAARGGHGAAPCAPPSDASEDRGSKRGCVTVSGAGGKRALGGDVRVPRPDSAPPRMWRRLTLVVPGDGAST